MAQPKQERLEFDRELGTIEAKVIELFSMVAEDLPKATERSSWAAPMTPCERWLSVTG